MEGLGCATRHGVGDAAPFGYNWPIGNLAPIGKPPPIDQLVPWAPEGRPGFPKGDLREPRSTVGGPGRAAPPLAAPDALVRRLECGSVPGSRAPRYLHGAFCTAARLSTANHALALSNNLGKPSRSPTISAIPCLSGLFRTASLNPRSSILKDKNVMHLN